MRKARRGYGKAMRCYDEQSSEMARRRKERNETERHGGAESRNGIDRKCAGQRSNGTEKGVSVLDELMKCNQMRMKETMQGRLNAILSDCKNQKELADKIGLPRQTLGNYLNGNRTPTPDILYRICKACDVSADWLLGLAPAYRRKVDWMEDQIIRIESLERRNKELEGKIKLLTESSIDTAEKYLSILQKLKYLGVLTAIDTDE